MTLPSEVVQLESIVLSPVVHSPLMSVYTCTECGFPSFEAADKDIYESGSDCLTKSVGFPGIQKSGR